MALIEFNTFYLKLINTYKALIIASRRLISACPCKSNECRKKLCFQIRMNFLLLLYSYSFKNMYQNVSRLINNKHSLLAHIEYIIFSYIFFSNFRSSFHSSNLNWLKKTIVKAITFKSSVKAQTWHGSKSNILTLHFLCALKYTVAIAIILA